MSIRRVGKADRPVTSPASSVKNRATNGVSGENFARQLADIAASHEVDAMEAVSATNSISTIGDREPTPHQRREQLLQTGELLNSLEALGRDMEHPTRLVSEDFSHVRQRLKETRDMALRTLSDTPASGMERDLLHRTAVLATVELAKSERGDYK